jgi:hypothetical protein
MLFEPRSFRTTQFQDGTGMRPAMLARTPACPNPGSRPLARRRRPAAGGQKRMFTPTVAVKPLRSSCSGS